MECRYEHKTEQIGASFDTDYEVITQCVSDCPACAYKAGRREVIEELGLRGATLKLESIDGKPVAMFNDGDYFEQTGELVSFLMHLSVMMPTWDTDTELIIIPRQALQHLV